MAVLDHTSYTTTATLPAALVKRVARAAAGVWKGWSNRRQFRRLAEMSDWELADIGLQRSDLHDAWSSRAALDPTAYLTRTTHRRVTLDDAARRIL